jgi:hypothetical protein
MAAEILSRALFASGQARTVIAIELPKSHAPRHGGPRGAATPRGAQQRGAADVAARVL